MDLKYSNIISKKRDHLKIICDHLSHAAKHDRPVQTHVAMAPLASKVVPSHP
jgi:predicted transcriptional regulator